MWPQEKADRLVQLARQAFPDPPVSEAEEKTVRAAAAGALASFLTGDREGDDPGNGEGWGPERTIRASVLRWLLVDGEAAGLLDPKGIAVAGVRIDGELDLGHIRTHFPLTLAACLVRQPFYLVNSELGALILKGTHVWAMRAEGLRTHGDVQLTSGFRANGEVRLLGAEIGGSLVCTGGQFIHPGAIAIGADRCSVRGCVAMDYGFRAEGQVRLLGASIGGNLQCNGAAFSNPKKIALNADSAQVRGCVMFHPWVDRGRRLARPMSAQGTLFLTGIRVGGSLEFNGARLDGQGGDALVLDACDCGGCLFLSDGFRATGRVRLLGARIGGNLDCDGGQFRNEAGESLDASGCSIEGNVFLRSGIDSPLQVFSASGAVRLVGTRVAGDLDCTGGTFCNANGLALSFERARIGGSVIMRRGFRVSGGLSAAHATATVLVDEADCWPARGSLSVDGFKYDAIHGPLLSTGRLDWIERQYPQEQAEWPDSFLPQPYDQLACVLRHAGYEREAKKVLIAKHRDERQYGNRRWLARKWDRFLGVTLGHGYRVWLLLFWALAFWVLGCVVLWQADCCDLIVPACAEGKRAQLPEFCALAYSLDVLVPLVNLRQEESWRPDTSKGARLLGRDVPWAGHALQYYVWLQILVGWLLVTLAVAGLTGIVRRE